MAPNDAGQDNYAGSVEQKMRDEALRKLREEHRGDPAWHHDPDHQLDEEAAIRQAQRQADQFIATQHDQLEHGLAMRGGPQTKVLAPPAQWGMVASKDSSDEESGVTIKEVVPGSAAETSRARRWTSSSRYGRTASRAR